MKFVCLRYPKLQMTFKPDIKREINGEILKERAVIIQFQDGFYETNDEKKIDFIKAHTEYGVNIHIVEDNSNTKPTFEEERIIGRARK